MFPHNGRMPTDATPEDRLEKSPFKELATIVATHGIGENATWRSRIDSAVASLFGTRYEKDAEKTIAIRAPGKTGDNNVPFAALIHPTNPEQGAYSGMSVVVFPVDGAACLVTFGVGTNGISPDEELLGNPGHARKVQAVCAWLNHKHGRGAQVAWAKYDPVRIDVTLPTKVSTELPAYASVFQRYGKELYGIYAPTTGNTEAILDVLSAFLDLMFEARGFGVLTPQRPDAIEVRAQWQKFLLPSLTQSDLKQLLNDRRYVVIQGPPGTGKTRMAENILASDYAGNGTSIQFHPNTTYESFVGGLAPQVTEATVGLQFAPTPGHLMEAVRQARMRPDQPYLLHIDEINRADISKILGEAIYLLEVHPDKPRTIELSYDFGEPFGRKLTIPDNLHILGTMNTADRSLAIVDVAVRRRFSFVDLWPQSAVVQELGGEVARDAFARLLTIFIDHASGDAFNLVPGHSYFLNKDDKAMKAELRVTLVPLLQEYLSQGYVTGFSEHIRGYLQWIDSL